MNSPVRQSISYYFEKEAEAVDLALEGDSTKFDNFINKLWNTNL
ncbi:MAG: hypothetical protein ACFFAE_06255 [Candidatus Hodarchaeota archaeon]